MAKSKSSAKELASKQRFAALYASGPERTRGNWAECNALLGTSFVETDVELRAMIEDEGGQAPGLGTTSLGQVKVLPPKQPAPKPNHEDWRLKLATSTPKTKDEWCKLADELRPTMVGIADGSVKATAAQASTLRHVFDRCFGKVQEKASEKRPASGVLILPMLGDGMTATICPRCGFELEDHDDGNGRDAGSEGDLHADDEG